MLATTSAMSSVSTRCSVALLSLSFLSMNKPTFSSVDAGLLMSSAESSGTLDGRRGDCQNERANAFI